MFNSPLLDLAISMVFVYFLLSLLVSGMSELLVTIFSKRGKDLKHAIDEVFNDGRCNKNWSELLYRHPLIDRLKRTEKTLPSYISSSVFSSALLDLMVDESRNKKIGKLASGEVKYIETLPTDNPYINFSEGVKKLNPSDVKTLLQTFVTESKDIDTLKTTMEKWYNAYMGRVSGWFKRDVQQWLFWISLLVTISLNVDSIHLTKSLWKDRTLREAVVKTAIDYVDRKNENISKEGLTDNINKYKMVAEIDTMNLAQRIEYIDSIYSETEALNLPIGWKMCGKFKREKYCIEENRGNFFEKWTQILIGWLISTFAISFGAPFWFDVLCKLVNLRKAGSKPKIADSKFK